jgi:hypothetical protein
MRLSENVSFFGAWAFLAAVGVLLLLHGGGAWQALGMLIVAPTAIAALLMSWGYALCRFVEACGGDPKGESVGMRIFLSFAFLLLPLLVAFLSRR